jgi:ATP-binding cassette subfamily A (ABC1) protein 3
LDEADLLADNIAILAAPGKLVAQGSPVALKSTSGEGYTIQVRFYSDPNGWHGPPPALLGLIRELTPLCHFSSSGPQQASYHLVSKDPKVVVHILELLDSQGLTHGVQTYDVLGTSIEDIFLDLMDREQKPETIEVAESNTKSTASSIHTDRPMELVSGQKRTPLSQAFTIFHKRALIARRAWLTPFLAVLVAVAGCCIPLFFLPTEEITCVREFRNTTDIPLYLPFSPLSSLSFSNDVLLSPPSAISYLGSAGATLSIQNITDNATFISSVQQTYRNLTLGGVSVDVVSGNALVAWEASPPGITGPTLLNLASNILYNAASNTTATGSSLIAANYASFPATYSRTLVDLKWVAFYAAAMVRLSSSIISFNLTSVVGCVPGVFLTVRIS